MSTPAPDPASPASQHRASRRPVRAAARPRPGAPAGHRVRQPLPPGPGARPGRGRAGPGRRPAGITRMVTVGTDLPSSYWAVACAADHDPVYAAVAIHPNDTVAVSGSVAEKEAVAAGDRRARPRAAGAGGGRDRAGLLLGRRAAELQQEWFRAHIAIAKQAGKALMIHDRDAHEDVLRILDEEGPPDQVVFHCFSGDAAMAKRCAAAGYVLSFAGTLTFKNAQPLRDAAAAVPAGAVLVETDAPFLTPMPNRGKSNSPARWRTRCARSRRSSSWTWRSCARSSRRPASASSARGSSDGCPPSRRRARSGNSPGGWTSGRPSGSARTSSSTRAPCGASCRWPRCSPATWCSRSGPGSAR